MTDINTVTIIGRLTKDLELKYTQTGFAIGSMSLAVNASKKKGNGWEDYANFFDVSVLGKTAESLAQYLKKGKLVGISGHLEQQRWQGQDGATHSKVVIIADDIQLCSPKDNVNQQNGYQPQPQQNQYYGNQQYQPPYQQQGEFFDDVPF